MDLFQGQDVDLSFGLEALGADGLPFLKLTAKAPENRPGPKRKLAFQPSIFRGYVSFRECKVFRPAK